MLKDKLTSEVAGIILRHVRNPKGRLTEVSELCRINRREFTIRGISRMKFHRLLRIFYALSLVVRYEEYKQMTDELRDVIQDYSDEYDYVLIDEKL